MSFKTRSIQEVVSLCRQFLEQPQSATSPNSPAMISVINHVCELLVRNSRGDKQIEELVRQVRSISVVGR